MTPSWRCLPFSEAPPGSDWLTPEERAVEAGLVRPERRQAWRAGRWALKSLLAEPNEPGAWAILPASDNCPEAFHRGRPLGRRVSLSHRAGWAAAAVAAGEGEVGVDLERVEARTERFVRDFFTEAEARSWGELGSESRDRYAVLVWSAKESALKCARTGLHRDTRSVEVRLEGSPGATEGSLSIADLERGLTLGGAWEERDGRILTLAWTTEPTG